MGLITINREEFKQLKNAKVLLRAHGEPPETYMIARENNIEIIDATCPVVLRLQKRIRQGYLADSDKPGEIIVARLGIALFAPHRKTVDIGTNRNHAGSLRNHRLIEMTRGQCLAQFPALSNDQTVKLHIAARRGTRGGFEHVLQHLRRNRLRAEFSDRTVFCKQCFHTDYKLRNKFTQK